MGHLIVSLEEIYETFRVDIEEFLYFFESFTIS
jgi:hypothetical protein